MSVNEQKKESLFTGRRVHVIGLGAYGTGRATAQVLSARGAVVTVSDVKTAGELASEIAELEGTGVIIQTGTEAYHGLEQAELVVLSPGVPPDIPPLLRAREHGAQVVSEIEVASWLARCPIIAVTGTKGKSTTTTLIGEILRDEGKAVRVGGNIGRPLIAMADQSKPEEILVAEVSSFQLEATAQFHPRVAVLLNLFPDHLDRHPDMTAYRNAKSKLFANQGPEDIAVINRDNAEAWTLKDSTKASVMPYSLAEPQPKGADLVEGWLRVKSRPVCPQSAVKLRGRHNLANALAALAAAQAIGASLEQAEATLSRFSGLEHRLELVATIAGVMYINDSQATTPEAAVVALEAFSEHVVLIAGGRPKIHDFDVLATALAAHTADLIVIGEAAEEIAAAAKTAGVKKIARAKNLEEAVRLAHDWARPGEVVLMSPACASFDMFKNMAERGRTFREIAAKLAVEIE